MTPQEKQFVLDCVIAQIQGESAYGGCFSSRQSMFDSAFQDLEEARKRGLFEHNS